MPTRPLSGTARILIMADIRKTQGGRGRWRLLRWTITSVLAAAAVFVFILWKSASDHGGQKPAEPFRIAGNLGSGPTSSAPSGHSGPCGVFPPTSG
jgi:hypothetical protein